MQDKQKNPFAYTVCENNDGGFTFISILLAISILAFLIPFIGYTLQAVNIPSENTEQSVQHFFLFLQEDVRNAEEIDITPSSLYMIQPRVVGRAVIRQHNDVILWQVNRQGSVVYLRDVEDIRFSEKDYGVHVTVTTLDGGNYEKTIIYYK